MSLWMFNVIAIFLLSVISSGFLIPQILLIAYRKRLFDEPDERKIHTSVVPRLGGIAFILVILFSLVFVLGSNLITGHFEVLGLLKSEIHTFSFAFCSVIVLYIVGVADDLIGVRYRAKFLVQIICGIMIILGGLWVDDLYGLCWIYQIPMWIGYPITIFVIVFIINAINLIDGIDGLASGLCSVAMITYGIAFYLAGEYIYSVIAYASLGVLLPFYYYNVFGDPNKHRKIFMGDTGSLTIGMIICILSLKILQLPPAITENNVNPFALAFSPMIIPCFDVVRVYFHRVRNGKNPFLPDKNHIHHKFLAIGINQKVTMVTILLTSVALVTFNVFLSRFININILLVIDVLLIAACNMWLSHAARKEQKKY